MASRADHTGDRVAWRRTGVLLVVGLVFVLVAAVVMVASGALSAFFDFLGGSLAGLEPYLSVFRFNVYLWALAWISLLMGFVGLTRLLVESVGEHAAVLSLAVTVVATVLATLEAVFTVGLTTWSVEEAATAGVTPEIYTVLAGGLFDKIQFAYTVLGFAAQAGFGVALLKSTLLPHWIGRITLIWGLVWLVADSFFFRIPALLLIMPAVIGASLLTNGRTGVTAPAEREGING
jgi:hypothetical protein